jgi:hypothetical protein
VPDRATAATEWTALRRHLMIGSSRWQYSTRASRCQPEFYSKTRVTSFEQTVLPLWQTFRT